MGMVPCIADLMPRIWHNLPHAATDQPPASLPPLDGDQPGVKLGAAAAAAADAALVDAWQQDCSGSLSPLSRAGPLICLSQLAGFKVQSKNDSTIGGMHFSIISSVSLAFQMCKGCTSFHFGSWHTLSFDKHALTQSLSSYLLVSDTEAFC